MEQKYQKSVQGERWGMIMMLFKIFIYKSSPHLPLQLAKNHNNVSVLRILLSMGIVQALDLLHMFKAAIINT